MGTAAHPACILLRYSACMPQTLLFHTDFVMRGGGSGGGSEASGGRGAWRAGYAANNEFMGDHGGGGGGGDSSRRESPNSVRGGRMRHGTGTVEDYRASCASAMFDTSPLPTLAADTPRHRQHFLRRRHFLGQAEAAPASGGSSPLPSPLRTFEQTIGKPRERRRSTEVMWWMYTPSAPCRPSSSTTKLASRGDAARPSQLATYPRRHSRRYAPHMLYTAYILHIHCTRTTHEGKTH